MDGRGERNGGRREAILLAATRLFAEMGFSGVGVNEIGAAAGVTGPAIYRHFRNKESLLVALYERLARRLDDAIEHARRESGSPREALESLVRSHVRIAMEERDLILVDVRERQHLPPDERERAVQQHRRYIDEWTELLSKLRSDLSLEARRTSIHAAIGLINSVGYHQSYLSSDDLERILTRMAMAALLA